MFHLESYNRSAWFYLFFKGWEPSAIRISTVELPRYYDSMRYESCAFYKDGSNDVLQTYETLEEAIKGHGRLADRHGLTKTRMMV